MKGIKSLAYHDIPNLIEQYETGPSTLRDAWLAVPAEVRQWRPAAGEWSAHEVVVHCADSESYAAIRIRLLAAESAPHIVGYDQERWAQVFTYHDLDPDLALSVIDGVRQHTSQVLRALGDEQWRAVGTHTESGTYSAMDWLQTYAVHLHDHADQIRSNLAVWRETHR